MNKNYMIYPMKYMRITCRYDEGAHKNHNINVTDGKVEEKDISYVTKIRRALR